MKNSFYLLVCTLFLMACSKKQKVNSEVLNIPIEATIARFDQEFMQATPVNFNTLKQKYPYLLGKNIADSVWFQKKQPSFSRVIQ